MAELAVFPSIVIVWALKAMVIYHGAVGQCNYSPCSRYNALSAFNFNLIKNRPRPAFLLRLASSWAFGHFGLSINAPLNCNKQLAPALVNIRQNHSMQISFMFQLRLPPLRSLFGEQLCARRSTTWLKHASRIFQYLFACKKANYLRQAATTQQSVGSNAREIAIFHQ